MAPTAIRVGAKRACGTLLLEWIQMLALLHARTEQDLFPHASLAPRHAAAQKAGEGRKRHRGRRNRPCQCPVCTWGTTFWCRVTRFEVPDPSNRQSPSGAMGPRAAIGKRSHTQCKGDTGAFPNELSLSSTDWRRLPPTAVSLTVAHLNESRPCLVNGHAVRHLRGI